MPADLLRPLHKPRLSDDLVQRVQALVTSGAYQAGERLPSISSMAQQLGVGQPTLREAIKQVEALGLVSVRHGSGVFVTKTDTPLFVSNTAHGASPSKKLLLDLVDARLPIEATTVVLAARHATPEDLARMERLLEAAAVLLQDPRQLGPTNMSFHVAIATASGNAVLTQLIEQIVVLFKHEQDIILDIYGSRERDHQEHLGLLDAIRQGDEALARERMQTHLGWVRKVLERWEPPAPGPAA